jgi:hypothetical protein
MSVVGPKLEHVVLDLKIFLLELNFLAFTKWMSLFDNSQPVSGDIMGVVRAGSSDFLVAEIRHFCY